MGPPRFFAPAFRVKVDGRVLEPEQTMAISEVVVTHEIGTSDQFSLTLASPYPHLPWTHGRDAALFKPGAAVTIEMGYVDDLQPMLSGEVTGLSPDFPSDGTATLQVDGHTRLHRLDGPRQTRTFQDMTDAEIVESIAQQVGLTARAERTPIRHAHLIQYNRTNLEFLRERAEALDFELLVEDRTLVFRKPQSGSPRVASLTWGETLRSFRPSVNSLEPVTEVIVRGYDPKTKTAIVGRAGAGAEEVTLGAENGARLVNSAFGSRTEVVVDAQPTSQAEAEQRAKAVFNKRMMELISGSGEAVGQPALRAGRVVELGGLGPRFNGLYYIVRSTHTIGSAGYRTGFSVRRNAVS
jgi:phage protein D